MRNRSIGQMLMSAAMALLVFVQPTVADADDEIDGMLQRGEFPADLMNPHGYSDFTDPLGRFLDLLAAGAFADARAIQPQACAAWLATRQNSAFSGKVWIWRTEVSLDSLCVPPVAGPTVK